MGIIVEFNPDLALRNISEFKAGKRKKEECIPENIKEGKIYRFLKRGQRNYYLFGEIPLLETDGKILSRPKASITILKAEHFIVKNQIFTKGEYKVIEIFRNKKKSILTDLPEFKIGII